MFLVGFNEVGLHQGPWPKKLQKLSDSIGREQTLSPKPPLFLSHNCIASSFQIRKAVSKIGNPTELLSRFNIFNYTAILFFLQ